MNRLYHYYTYGAAVTAAGAVLTSYYSHPIAAAVSTAVAVVSIANAFREATKSVTAQVTATVEQEIDRLHEVIDRVPTTILMRLEPGAAEKAHAEIVAELQASRPASENLKSAEAPTPMH